MKTFPLFFTFLSLGTAFPAVAQVTPLGAGAGSVANARSAADVGGDLKRLDLEFPGGTPEQLVAAISRGLGRPLNAIIPEEQKDTRIMPIKVFGVTVPELFSALESASSTESPIVTRGSRGGAGNRAVEFRNVAMGFRPNTTNVTDQTVWSFFSTAPSPEFLEVMSESPTTTKVCQYFQLAPYLDDHNIEDITTAIQTGWEMLKVEPKPQLRFHQETKLLIAVGPTQHIAQIPQVLEQLQRDNTVAVDKIARWQAELAALEAKKEAGWEQKADEIKSRIRQVGDVQRAREEIRNPAPLQRTPAIRR